jgi:hypothetical protein
VILKLISSVHTESVDAKLDHFIIILALGSLHSRHLHIASYLLSLKAKYVHSGEIGISETNLLIVGLVGETLTVPLTVWRM